MSGDFAAIQDIHGAILDAKDDDQDFMDSVGEILFGNYFLGWVIDKFGTKATGCGCSIEFWCLKLLRSAWGKDNGSALKNIEPALFIFKVKIDGPSLEYESLR